MIFSIKILESDAQIKKIILESIKQHVEKAMKLSIEPISSEIKALVASALRAEPEYQSLINGQLRIEFGIPDTSVVNTVIEMMTDTLKVTISPIKSTNFGLSGGFVITMIKSDDIDGIINTDASMVNDTNRGHRLPWLEWLLLHANQPIIRNYEVKIGSNPASRTGMGIMVRSNKNWRVPPEFAGSEKNNWTTRAIARIDNQLPKIFENNIIKNI